MNFSQFKQRLSTNEKPIVIDFWAPWCAPCRITKPVLEKLATEFGNDIEFMPINADESQDIIQSLKVYGIPTVITYRGGRELARVAGAQTEANYRAMFASLAAGKEVQVPLTWMNRMIRLGLGGILTVIGISTSNWLVVGIGGATAFMGVYDRCPIWRAITELFRK